MVSFHYSYCLAAARVTFEGCFFDAETLRRGGKRGERILRIGGAAGTREAGKVKGNEITEEAEKFRVIVWWETSSAGR